MQYRLLGGGGGAWGGSVRRDAPRSRRRLPTAAGGSAGRRARALRRLWLAGASASAARAPSCRCSTSAGRRLAALPPVPGAWASAADGGVACSCDEGWAAPAPRAVCVPPWAPRHLRRAAPLVRLRPRPLRRGVRAHTVRARLRRPAARATPSLETAGCSGGGAGPRTVRLLTAAGAARATRLPAAVCKRGFTGCDCRSRSRPVGGGDARWSNGRGGASRPPRRRAPARPPPRRGSELWRLDPKGDRGAADADLVAAPAPARRGGAGAADRGVVVVHGGLRMQSSGGTAAVAELWALHCGRTSWVAPTPWLWAPPPRRAHAYHTLTAAVGGGDDYGGLAFGDDDDGPPLVLYLGGPLRRARGSGGARGDGGGAHAAQGV